MSVSVTITGSGNSSNCYVTIGGTKYITAATTTVNAGDTITFLVKGRSSSYVGKVTIDGAEVLKVTSNTTSTYNWVVPDGLMSISIALSYSSGLYAYGTIIVTTEASPKTHRTLIEGVGFSTLAGRCLVDGVGYSIRKGRTLIDGVGYDVKFSAAPYLHLYEDFNDRNANRSFTVSDTSLAADVRGGDNANWAGYKWGVYKDGRPYQLQVGDAVEFAFTGTRYGSYCDYRIIFTTNLSDAWNSKVTSYANSAQDRTYTATQQCYICVNCEIGGTKSSSLYATMNLTKLKINGEDVLFQE